VNVFLKNAWVITVIALLVSVSGTLFAAARFLSATRIQIRHTDSTLVNAAWKFYQLIVTAMTVNVSH